MCKCIKLLLLVEIGWAQIHYFNEPLWTFTLRKIKNIAQKSIFDQQQQNLCEHGGLNPITARKDKYIPVNMCLGPDQCVPPCDILYVLCTHVRTKRKIQNSIVFWFLKPTPHFRISKPIRFNHLRIVSISSGFGIGRRNKYPSVLNWRRNMVVNLRNLLLSE